MPDDKEPIPVFAKRIKEKYPEYKDVNDTLLVQKIVAKYPEYESQVDLSPLKKKETSGGITSSPLPSQSGGGLFTGKGIQGTLRKNPDELETFTPKNDIADPVGDVINEPESKFTKGLQGIKQSGRLGFNAAESVAPNTTKFQKDRRTAKEIATEEYNNSSKEYKDALDVADKNFFPSPIEAGNYVKKMVQEHGVDAVKDNRTVQLAYGKFNRYENLKKLVNEQPDIRQLAVDLARKSDYNLDKQILQLEGGKEDDRGLDRYENVIPQAVQGRLVDEFINNKDLPYLAEENPAIKSQLAELKNGGVYKAYPEYGEIVARNMISREYQKRRANKVVNPIFNKSSYLDKLADELFADNPALKEIADTRLKGKWEGKIDTSGLVDEFGTGAKNTFEGMGESIKDLLGGGKTEMQRIEEGLKKEYEGVHSGVTGAWAKLGHAANFAGMLGAMAATGSPLRGAGMSPTTAHTIVSANTFFDQELNNATMKFPGEEGKALASAAGMTALYTLGLKNAIPTKQLGEIFSKARPELETALKNLSKDAVEAEIKGGILRPLTGAIKGTLKGAAEMSAITALNTGLDRALGLNGQEMAKYHPDSELGDVAESMLIGLAGPQLLTSFKNRQSVANSIYDIASSPDRYKSVLEGREKGSEDIDMKLDNIDFLSGLKKELDDLNIPEEKQKRFLLESLQQKQKRDSVPLSPDSAIRRKNEAEINRYEEIKDRILSGEEVPPLEGEEGLHEEAKLIEEQPEEKNIETNSSPSVIMPGEIKHPETTTIAPKEFEAEPKTKGPAIILPKPEIAETKESEAEPPPNAPGEPAKTTEEKPGNLVGITHAQTDAIAKQFGLETYEKDPEKVSEWDKEADKRLAEDPETLPKLFDKLRKGDAPDKIDNRVMIKYMADLVGKVEKKPTPELLNQLKRAKDLFNVAGREWGKAGVARQGGMMAEDNLANFLLDRGGDKGRPLSERQIDEETKKYNVLKAAKEKLEEQLEREREQYTKMAAEYGINQTKAAAKKASKKTHEERVAERQELAKSIGEKWKNAGKDTLSSDIPYRKQLAAVAKDVKKYAESLIGEGFDTLDVLVSEIHAQLKDKIDGLTKKQVSQMIAGEFDEKGETKAQKASKLRLIQKEAKLLEDLDRARKGLEKEKSETKQDEKTRRIIELEDQIKAIREKNKRNLSEEEVEDRSFDPEDQQQFDRESAADSKYRERLQKRAEKLQSDINNKKYEPDEKPAVKFAKSAKTLEMEDKVIALEKKLNLDRMKDQLGKRSKGQKVYDFATREILGTKRILQTMLDWSVWARQTGRLVSNPRKWGIFAKEVAKSWESTWSQKKFDRYMREIHQDPQFKEMEKDGIKFNEFETHEVDKENEFYQKNWLFKVPILKELPLSSQRAADSALNVARYELYKKYRKNLEDNGITRESDPEVYESMAAEVMNQTGRGKLLKGLENNANLQKYLGNTFYGARLMAANFNQLSPRYYMKMPKEVRQLIWKDIASYVVTTMATGAGLAAAGGKISFNPNDSDFLQVSFGDKHYDLTAGKAQYIRTYLRILNAAMKAGGALVGANTKHEMQESSDNAFKSTLGFFRNKLAPNTGLALNFVAPGSDYGGREVGLKQLLEYYPMYADDVVKAAQDEGFLSIATTLIPNLIGVGYNQYFTDPADQPVDELIKRSLNSDKMDKEKIFNYKDKGRKITMDEFEDFTDKRDKELERRLKIFYEQGLPVGGGKFKPYKELTKEEIAAETNVIKADATRKVKEQLFGKKKNTSSENRTKKQVSEQRDKMYGD